MKHKRLSKKKTINNPIDEREIFSSQQIISDNFLCVCV